MSYWDTQYKHAEIARIQNKREERLLQMELEAPRGVRDIHKYNMQAVEHEQRLIERELERIRKGMNKKYLHPYASGNVGNLAFLGGSHVPLRRQGRHENAVVNTKYAKEILPPSRIDNTLFRTIVPGENERPAPYEPSDTVPGHLAKTPRAGDVQSVETYPGLVLSQGEYQSSDLTRKERSLRSHIIDSFGKDLPTRTQVDTVIGIVDDLDSQDQSIERTITDRGGGGRQNGIPESESSRNKRRPLRTSLDIAQLASLDMKSVKSDVSRRLSQDNKGSGGLANNSSVAKQEDKTDTAQVQDEAKPKEKTRKVSRSKVPAVDSHKKVTDFDPEHYNPDGSLRKMHAMPAMDKTWEEAKKARYIRTKETVEREKELTVEEIFDKSSPKRPYKL